MLHFPFKIDIYCSCILLFLLLSKIFSEGRMKTRLLLGSYLFFISCDLVLSSYHRIGSTNFINLILFLFILLSHATCVDLSNLFPWRINQLRSLSCLKMSGEILFVYESGEDRRTRDHLYRGSAYSILLYLLHIYSIYSIHIYVWSMYGWSTYVWSMYSIHTPYIFTPYILLYLLHIAIEGPPIEDFDVTAAL